LKHRRSSGCPKPSWLGILATWLPKPEASRFAVFWTKFSYSTVQSAIDDRTSPEVDPVELARAFEHRKTWFETADHSTRTSAASARSRSNVTSLCAASRSLVATITESPQVVGIAKANERLQVATRHSLAVWGHEAQSTKHEEGFQKKTLEFASGQMRAPVQCNDTDGQLFALFHLRRGRL